MLTELIYKCSIYGVSIIIYSNTQSAFLLLNKVEYLVTGKNYMKII